MQIILQRGLTQLSIVEGSNHQTGITTEQRAEKGIICETFTYHGEKNLSVCFLFDFNRQFFKIIVKGGLAYDNG